MERENIAALIRAVADERDDFPDFIETMRYEGALPRAFRKLARLNPSLAFRRRFLDFWLRYGDSIRGDTNDDLALLDGLRALLPPYRGKARRVYRAESVRNHRYRTYGISWSEANDVQRMFGDPGVLLECLAPPQAIVCRVPRSADRYGEQEVIVDRRKLTERPRVIRNLEYRPR